MLRFDVALETLGVAGKAPEVGAVVDVEHHLTAIGLGDADRLALGGIAVGFREMRAGNDDGARRADKVFVDVVFAERHVGTVGAHEDHWRDTLVLDRQQHQGGQPFLVGGDALYRDALAYQLFADEAAHLLVANAGEQRRAQAEPRGADRNVGRAAADRLGEGGDVFEARADLLAVKVDRCTANGDDVERTIVCLRFGHGFASRRTAASILHICAGRV